jgi:hypothetical protein
MSNDIDYFIGLSDNSHYEALVAHFKTPFGGLVTLTYKSLKNRIKNLTKHGLSCICEKRALEAMDSAKAGEPYAAIEFTAADYQLFALNDRFICGKIE